MINVKEIQKYTNGIESGDNCEKCETELKPIYHLESQEFGLDIILCPNCLEKFKGLVSGI